MRVSSETTRWIAAVESRARRESPPALDLWNPGPKPDFAAAVARETHHAGARVRKSTTRPPPTRAFLPGQGDAVVLKASSPARSPPPGRPPRETNGRRRRRRRRRRHRIPPSRPSTPSPRGLSTRVRGIRAPASTSPSTTSTATFPSVPRTPPPPRPSPSRSAGWRRRPSSASSPAPRGRLRQGVARRRSRLCTIGERARRFVFPRYAYLHPDANRRGRRPDPGVGVEDALVVDVELLDRRLGDFAVRLPNGGKRRGRTR